MTKEPEKKEVEVNRVELLNKGFKCFTIGPLVVITRDNYIINRQIDLLNRGNYGM